VPLQTTIGARRSQLKPVGSAIVRNRHPVVNRDGVRGADPLVSACETSTA
jgi:hypothetical protein